MEVTVALPVRKNRYLLSKSLKAVTATMVTVLTAITKMMVTTRLRHLPRQSQRHDVKECLRAYYPGH